MSAHYSTIVLDRVEIPVMFSSAIQDNDIKFNQIHRKYHERINYLKVCPSCPEGAAPEDIVKGYQYEKGRYVIFSKEDFEELKTSKDKNIEIIYFTEISAVNPVLYNKTYNVTPTPSGEKSFELLRRVMNKTNTVAVAETVIGTTETPLILIPMANIIRLTTLFFVDDVREIKETFKKPEPNERELELAETIVNSRRFPFEAEHFHKEYRMRLMERIQEKQDRNEIVIEGQETVNTANLLESLRASFAHGTNSSTNNKENSSDAERLNKTPEHQGSK